MIKNACFLMLKVLFVLETFKCLLRIFDYEVKRLDKKAKVNF